MRDSPIVLFFGFLPWGCSLALACSLAWGCNQREPTLGASSASEAASPAREPTKEKPTPKGLLAVGEPAPDFTVAAHNGQRVRLSELRGKAVVLYFYPKDGTPGCTVEAQEFSAEHENLSQAGAVVLGVSSDDSESHADFAREHGLPFLLLPDPDHTLARAYGVPTTFGLTSRVTFLIDRQGKIARVYEKVVPKTHASEILSDLSQL